ncbi:hypothetical protein [Domibacillus antri]
MLFVMLASTLLFGLTMFM